MKKRGLTFSPVVKLLLVSIHYFLLSLVLRVPPINLQQQFLISRMKEVIPDYEKGLVIFMM